MTKEDNQIDNFIEERKQPKEMISFYCDLNLVNFLDDFIHLTKKELPINKKKKLNRTSIIHLILRALMEDWAKKQDQSFLNKLILEWKND